MSKQVGTMKHPIGNHTEPIFEGFSWPCFFFGGFWYLAKGMVAWGIIGLMVALVTYGFSWLVFPFFANKQYQEFLGKKGYIK
jgi:hypothetical protein